MIKELLAFFVYLKLIRCQNANLETYVVRGNNSKIEEFPHSVYIESFCGNKKISKCGSSMLNQWILLTAAHCMPFNECSTSKSMTARFGHEDKTKGIENEATQYVIHEDYSNLNFTVKSDIALVLLDKPVKFSTKISRVAIVKKPVGDEDIVTMAGWGYVEDIKKEKTNLLKQTTQWVISRDRCQNYIGNLPEGVFCAMDRRGKSYPAGGDSGSALMFRKYIQVGLVSYKLPHRPNIVVYTDVAYYYDWIRENAYRLICSKGGDEDTLINGIK